MEKLRSEGEYTVPADIKPAMQSMFDADFCDDKETTAAIRKTFDESGYVMDTHTAVAKCVYDKYRARTGDNTKTIIASTASPFKFNQSVLIALEDYNAVAGKDEFELLELLREKSGMKVPESLAELKDRTPIFNTVVEKDQMQNTVSDF